MHIYTSNEKKVGWTILIIGTIMKITKPFLRIKWLLEIVFL